MANPVKNPNDLNLVKESTFKPRDDAFNKKMEEFHQKRKALLDAKPSKYLEPEWDALRDEMQQFRSGYEKPQRYSLREYMLDNDPDEFQIDRIRDDIDFQGVLDEMQKGKDFYEAASVDGNGFDSAVREKLFDAMSQQFGIDYDDIYELWLHGTPLAKSAEKRKAAQKAQSDRASKWDAFKKGTQYPQGLFRKELTDWDSLHKDLSSGSAIDSDEAIDMILRMFGK